MHQDEELDYGPLEGEIPDAPNQARGSSKRKDRTSPCHVCGARFTNVRRHMLCSHLPWYVAPFTACWTCKIQFAQDKLLQVHTVKSHNGKEGGAYKFTIKKQGNEWVDLMNGLLLEIGNQLGLSTAMLTAHINNGLDFTCCKGSFHHWTDIPLIRIFNQRNQYHANDVSHQVFPLSHIHSILHWKVLSLLIKQTAILVNYESPYCLKPCQRKEPVICLVDSHFHLDMYLKETRCSGLPLFSWKEEQEEIKLQYLIANYCFPHNWPSSKKRQVIREDRRLKLTFGIHPRIVNLDSKKHIDNWLADLEILVDAKGVVAIGECGLDFQKYTTEKDLDRQGQILEHQLQLARAKDLPVVIHCRGDERIEDKCLLVMQKVLDHSHPVHRHCFKGSLAVYKKWKMSFPKCKFGISPFLLMDNKHPSYRATICEMDVKDLVLETDAPYLSGEGRRTGCPSLIKDIAVKLASMFNMSLQEVASVTTSNALKLYRM